MNTTVILAKQYGVAVGAHPSLPDLQGFGRREMAIEPVKLPFFETICSLMSSSGRIEVLFHISSWRTLWIPETAWTSSQSRMLISIVALSGADFCLD